MSKIIPLTQGQYALVDDNKYTEVSKHKWHSMKMRNKFYAATKIEKKIVFLHRFILNCVFETAWVDHKNGNTLDCTKQNLRKCTHSQNSQNRKLRKDSSNKYKGINYLKASKRWIATLKINKKRIYLGCFSSEREAGEAYDKAAKKYFGEFAKLNFPTEA